MTLQERKQNLMKLIQQKSVQYQQVDNMRTGLNNEILMLQGKLNILDELLAEEEKEVKDELPKA